ncbi:DUF664 domain-containing protein [Maribacter sp. SA7]|uniref:mycothiol transferase n=1 Tax=Maribacter zhoushanensis TaxID=3030012 RepID=UPI0023EB7658|nr:DUF664 domain-containing protein [Maribacter zhoushanensis]MDF4203606.1 DUF664 domain-containing protein [Maribacter zhoushanensis]
MRTKLIATILILSTATLIAQKEISRDWTSFAQNITITTDQKIKFRVTASAKTITDEDSSWSGLWARADTKDGENGFFDNMGDRPILSNEWKTYTIEGEIDKNAKALVFGGLCSGNGKFFYDNFIVETEKPDGSFEKLDIKNPSFEQTLTESGISGWSNGISEENPVKIKEFTFTNTDDTADGKNAIIIVGEGVVEDKSNLIGPIEGFTPQIGTLVTMLDNLSIRIEKQMSSLDVRELDHIMDKEANSIGALIMHLIATEVYYQNLTFDEMEYDEEDTKQLDIAMALGEGARNSINGKEASYYFNLWKKVRAKTKENFKARDDAWLAEVYPGSNINNHFSWFHVMEHQSSHLGQMLLLRKRIPPAPKPLTLPKLNKN